MYLEIYAGKRNHEKQSGYTPYKKGTADWDYYVKVRDNRIRQKIKGPQSISIRKRNVLTDIPRVKKKRFLPPTLDN